MIPEIAPIWKQWEETQTSLLEAIHEFPAARWQWQPAPQARPAAEIVAHIVRSEAGYALVIVNRREERERWLLPITDAASAQQAVTAVGQLVHETLSGLDANTLRQVHASTWGPLGYGVEGQLDAYWFCLQMVRHKAFHMGQLIYLSQLAQSELGKPA